MSAPRPAPLLPLRRDTAAVAAWRGRARTHPDDGGARGTSRSWTFLYWGGGQAPILGRVAPPILCTCRWWRRRGGWYKTGARRRPLPRRPARQRPSLLARRPTRPPRRGRCRGPSTREDSGHTLLHAAAPAATCVGAGVRLCMHHRAIYPRPASASWQATGGLLRGPGLIL